MRAFRRYLDLKFRCKRSCPELKIIDAYLSEKSLSYFYGLVKLHKPELCIRPIVSTCSSPLEGISKWLDFRLQHYYRSLPSYLRDSTQFVDEIRDRMPLPCETMVTLDIVSLYTSIPTEVAIDIVLADLAQHNDPWLPAIKLGLQLVMQHNYFEFGDTLWLQRQGTAMGTSVAPAFASLYVAHFEAIVRREFSAHMAYYRRFIDDIFILWFDADLDPALPSLMAFKDRLSELSRLNFTITTSPSEINFLDLTVLRYTSCQTPDDTAVFHTRTFQKPLNLHLYLPAKSAHPTGVLKSTIFGLVQTYWHQNSLAKDRAAIIKALFERLILRGHKARHIRPIFRAAIRKATNNSPGICDLMARNRSRNVFFELPFDPNGPSQRTLRTTFRFPQLNALMERNRLGRIIMCYTRPPNLSQLIGTKRLRDHPTLTPATLLVQRPRLENPTPNP